MNKTESEPTTGQEAPINTLEPSLSATIVPTPDQDLTSRLKREQKALMEFRETLLTQLNGVENQLSLIERLLNPNSPRYLYLDEPQKPDSRPHGVVQGLI